MNSIPLDRLPLDKPPFSINRAMVDRILQYADGSDQVDPAKLDTAVRYLYVIFRQVHILHQSYGRQLPSRDLTTLFASIRRIKERLYERDFAEVRDALEAASLSLNLRTFRDPEKHINIGSLFGELDDALRSINSLIAHLSEQKAAFLAMSEKARDSWVFRGKTFAEQMARQALYPYLQYAQPIETDGKRTGQLSRLGSPEDIRGWADPNPDEAEGERHVTPQLFALKQIARMYKFLYGKKLAMTKQNQKPNYNGQLRFDGPGTRFACAVILELELAHIYGIVGDNDPNDETLSPDDLIEEYQVMNKVGGMWTRAK